MEIETLREQFPITKNFNFQNTAAVAPVSERVVQAIHAYCQRARDFAHVDSDFYKTADHVRQQCATLIGAKADEIAFTKNTTEGLCFVANGLNWHSGDNVVTTNVEFPANIYPWMNLQSRGVRLRMVMEEAGRIPLEKLAEAIDHRTRLVAISAVQFGSGYRTDLAELGRICQEKGVLLCVDAIQALGVVPIDVEAMHIDFLSADGHKWICGPEGAGIFYCRKELIGHISPSCVGWMSMKNTRDFGKYQFEFKDDARRYDSGSYNIPGIYGLGAAVDLLLEVGIDNIYNHVRKLTDRLVDGLHDKHYRVVSSRRRGEDSGIVAFTSDMHDHEQIRQHLRHEHRLIIAVRQGRLRASPHMFTTAKEIDQLIHLLPAH